MACFAINGRFTARKLTGQERFARELIAELDNICSKDEFVLVVPSYADDVPNYQNIAVVRYGNVKSHFWEQINFYHYVKKNGLLSVNLTTTCPFLDPGVVCIHDAAYFEIADLLTRNLYGKFSTIWHRLLAKAAAKRAKKILTVSNYSKNRLSEILNIAKERIDVVYDAWQHFNRVDVDDSIFEKLPSRIERKKYFFALSSLSPQKNFIWITEVAKRNPNQQFVICGKSENISEFNEDTLKNGNIFFTGYISDSQVKALMKGCRAFIHPAVYEGFGIPPLEAMSCGAQVIASNATCLPELYEDAVHYIDPHDYNVDLESLLQEPVAPPDKILEKFSWEKEAKKLLEILRKLDRA